MLVKRVNGPGMILNQKIVDRPGQGQRGQSHRINPGGAIDDVLAHRAIPRGGPGDDESGQHKKYDYRAMPLMPEDGEPLAAEGRIRKMTQKYGDGG